MRLNLKSLEGERRRFVGAVDQYGSKRGHKGPEETILLKDIRDMATNDLLTDHAWLTVGKQLRKLRARTGDRLEFDATITSYTKGYSGHRKGINRKIEHDYRLSHHRNFQRTCLDGISIEPDGAPRVFKCSNSDSI